MPGVSGNRVAVQVTDVVDEPIYEFERTVTFGADEESPSSAGSAASDSEAKSATSPTAEVPADPPATASTADAATGAGAEQRSA